MIIIIFAKNWPLGKIDSFLIKIAIQKIQKYIGKADTSVKTDTFLETA